MTITKPRILVMRAAGINCDVETAAAVELAGGVAERVHVNRLVDGDVRLSDYAGLIIPGGFSYGDHLGAGRLLAIDLKHRLGEDLQEFVAEGWPVLGICNGFQVLVKAGLLGVDEGLDAAQTVTLTDNASGHYECRWVRLAAAPGSRSVFLEGIMMPFNLPVGHGEGRLLAPTATIDRLAAEGQVAMHYVDAAGIPTMEYPANPNGALQAIAGLANRRGNVLGLMPHPDRAYLPQLHPAGRRIGRREGDGLAIFRNMVRYAGSGA